MTYIFMSYGLENRDDAAWLSDQLSAKGFEMWADTTAEATNAERLEKVKNCQVFMILMTPLASRSARVQRESLLAAQHQKAVFPVLLKGEVFPDYRSLPYIDLREGLSVPGAMVKMLKALLADGAPHSPDDDTLPETALGQPQALRDLAKIIRTGLGGSQPRGITQELERVNPEDADKVAKRGN